ncbi:hypothetical protein DS893_14060 [Vibrionales bacterium C3R12]|nr:hypothetical protein DS893_14060 [Vibrionales bacterium C3R12]
MGIQLLSMLESVSNTLVIDKNGKLLILADGVSPSPGDVIVGTTTTPDNNSSLNVEIVGEDNDIQPLPLGDDIAQILQDIEDGIDPTLNEEQAAAAGAGLSSSVTLAASIEATLLETLAETFFETTANSEVALSETQSLALLDLLVNATPFAATEIRSFDEESQDSALNLTLPADSDGDVLTITVTELPNLGQITLADGTPISIGQELTLAEFDSLQYDAPDDYVPGDDAGAFGYSVDDNQGEDNSIQQGEVQFRINPINDLPVASDSSQTTDENQILTAQVPDATDVDGTISSYQVVDDVTQGQLTFNLDGSYSFDPGTDFDFLAAGESSQLTFTYTATDNEGGVSETKTVTITVQGLNDPASISGDDSGAVTEDTSLPLLQDSGSLRISDLDGDDEASFKTNSVVAATGALGALTLTEAGDWSYSVANAAVQYLGEGETKSEVFTVESLDGTEHTITVTITGVNDAAVITGVDTGAVIEDAANPILSDSGKLEVTDVDGADEAKFDISSVTPAADALGSITVDESGNWDYTVANDKVQYLGEGETKSEVFTVESLDGTEHTITVTITGVNDAAVITGVDTGAVIEDAANPTLSDSGKLGITDVDGTDEAKFDTNSVTSSAGVLGSLTVNESGNWDYTVANENVQYLGEGETESEVFTVKSLDGTEHTITVTITGVNDAAEITGVDTGTVIEDAANPTLNDSGKLEITDVDGADEAKFDTTSVVASAGALGSLILDESGNWDYTVTNDKVQYLGEGEIKSEVFTAKSLDGTEHTITVTITGVNDAAVITGVDTGAVIEDAANPTLSDSGKLEITDADGTDEAKFDTNSVTSSAGVLGSLTVNESGNWDYTVDNAKVQYLGEGETKSEQFTVESLDGTEHTITVTITGVNDAAEITGVDTGAVTEDAANPILSDSGKLEITDVDGADEAKFDISSVTPAAGVLGSITVDESGNWDYTVANAKVQYLGEGETKSELFTVKSLDGTEHTITVTITGVNDAAVITGIDTGAVTEDAANPMLTDSGKLEITDVDGADEAKFDISSVTPAADALGSITIDESGNWDYTVANDKVQYLGEGETKSEVFTVESLDGTEHTITVTITGVNDAAEISGDALGSVVEDTNSPMLSDNGSLRISDTDGSDEASFKTNSVVASADTLGALTLTEAGDWSYSVANAAVQYLGEGETKSEVFTVESLDGTEHTITVTITGVNDAAVITGIDTGAVTEDAVNPTLSDSGKLEITDVDGVDEAKFDTNSIIASSGALGNLTIDESGNWDYSVDNAAVQYLGEGETKSELFTVKSLDGTDHTITVTITGVNDAAEITGIDTGAVIEDAANPMLSDSGKLEITDVDGTDEAKFDTTSVTASVGALGSLIINESGNWDYSVANAKVQYLGEGETKSEQFTVESLDGTEHTITVTITGVNDAAVITGVDTGAVIEDAANPTLSDSGKLEITDVDGTDEAKFDISSVAPATDALGSITIDELGNWDYSVANDKVQYLGEGETKSEVFTVESLDGTEHTITVTITGVNDDAQFSNVSSRDLVETDAVLSTSGDLDVVDVDGDNTIQPIVNQAGNYGIFNINSAGVWTFVAKETFDYLNVDDAALVDVFTVKSADGTETNITVTISGTNDAPVATADVSSLGEDSPSVVVDVLSNDTDVDNSNLTITSATITTLDGSGSDLKGRVEIIDNKLTFFTDGQFDYLNDNQTADVQIQYVISDGKGGTDTETLTITVNGSNDAAVIDGDLVKVLQETDAALSTSGDLTNLDVDNANEFKAQTNAGQYGTFSIDTSGHWTFDAHSAYDNLNTTSAPLVSEFTVTAVDGTTQIVKVTIEGTNDGPVAYDSTESTTENLILSSQVTDAFDVDGTIANYQLVSSVGKGHLDFNANGSFDFDPQNAFDHLKVGVQETVTFTYTATDNSGTASEIQTVTITVTGQNDAPHAVVGSLAETVQEDNIYSATGTLIAQDVDDGATHTWRMVGLTDSEFGEISITTAGVWTYTLDNVAAQKLAEGETRTETFAVEVDDGLGGTRQENIVISIKGTNDLPEISGPDAGSVTEDIASDNQASGQLMVSDDDVLDGHTWNLEGSPATNASPASYQGLYGTITLTASGLWEYTLDDTKVDFLAANETRKETFDVLVDDGHSGQDSTQIVITINGTNDAPNISGDTSLLIKEDQNSGSISGDLNTGDVDLTDDHVWGLAANEDGAGRYGTFSIDPDSGSWTYVIDNDKAQELQKNRVYKEKFTVQVDDDNGGIDTQVITVKVKGTNDAPVIDGAHNDTGLVIEDRVFTAQGDLDVSDVDVYPTSDNHQWRVVGGTQGLYGSISVDNNGVWTYTLDPAKSNFMEEGVTYQEQAFRIRVTDGRGGKDFHEVNVEVIGHNDKPDINGVSNGLLTEDVTTQATGQLLSGDPDENETHVWSILGSQEGSYGSISIDQNGQWTYDLESTLLQGTNTQALAEGERVQETFTIQVIDKHNQVDIQEVTLDIVGTNDQPVISGTFANAVTEDDFPANDINADITTSGTLNHGDVDTTDDHSWSLKTGKGHYGSISIDDDGKWTYVLDNTNSSVQELLSTESLTETFYVTVKDDSGTSNSTSNQETITVTIHGSNDKPTLTGTTSGSVIEDSGSKEVASGQLVVSDIDVNDTHTWKVLSEDVNGVANGTYGTLEVDSNGLWTYHLDSDRYATREIPPGINETDSFQVEVTDLDGASTLITVNIDVAGTNTTPDINLDASYSIVEDSVPNLISGTFDSGDPDRDDVLDWEIIGSTGQYGTLTLNPNGSWSYSLDNGNNAVNRLDQGDVGELHDSIQIRVTDKFGETSVKTVVIDIDGANDAPNIKGALSKTISEDVSTVSGQLQDGDPDADDNNHIWSPSSLVGSHGNFIMSSTGAWTYLLNKDTDAVQNLNPNQHLTETFDVTVEDEHGATSTKTVTVTIQGSNDLPTISGDVSDTFTENQTPDHLSGKLDLDDIDNLDTPQFTPVPESAPYQGNYGTFSIDADGHWKFTPNAALIESLAEGDSKTETFNVVATDDFGGVVTQDIEITIKGTNDIPLISGASSGSVVEDSADLADNSLLQASGQLVSTDVDNNSSLVSWAIEDASADGGADFGVGKFGTLTLGNNGEWLYVLDNTDPDTQALNPGDVATETFYVSGTDNDGGKSANHTITIEVHGWDNDSGSGSGGTPIEILKAEVTEDGTLVQTALTDPGGLPLNVVGTAEPVDGGSFGSLVKNATSGEWEYQLANDSALVQGLKTGQVINETWRINTGSGFYTVNIAINGTDDKPEITFATDTPATQDDLVVVGETIEDITTNISGVLGVDDPDFGDSHTWSIETNAVGTYGSLTLNSVTGEWEYQLDNGSVVNGLDAGEVQYDNFTIKVVDSDGLIDTREIQIKVVGSAEDISLGDVEILRLNAQEDIDDQDGAVDGVITQDGTLQLPADSGLGANPTWTLVDGAGTYGNITVDANGHWVFTLDNNSTAVQGLQDGDSVQDVFAVYVVDENGKTVVDEHGDPELLEIVVDVTGTNDIPSIGGKITGSVDADNSGSISGQLTTGDVDNTDTHTWIDNSIAGTYGLFSLGANGKWTYDVDETNPTVIALNGRTPADTLTETFNVQLTDHASNLGDPSTFDTQDIIVTIHGTNEAPTIAGVDSAVLSEDNVVSVTRNLTADDVDSGDTVKFVPKTIADGTSLKGTYGEFTIDEDGEWSYSIYNSAAHVQALAEGESASETFIVTAKDDSGASVTRTVTVHIEGSNDLPTLSGDDSGAVSAVDGSTATGKLAASDVDVGDTTTYHVKTDGTLGAISIDANGHWTYEIDETNPAVIRLAQGESTTDTVQIIAKDNHSGESVPMDIVVTINGTNDAPDIVAIATQQMSEDTLTSLSGVFDSGDPDLTDTHNWQVVSGDSRGTLVVNSTTGAWDFDFNNTLDEFQELAVGESITLQYMVKVTDEHGLSDTQLVEFEVNGTNDLPSVELANSEVNGRVEEEGVSVDSGSLVIFDKDTSDVHAFKFDDDSQDKEGSCGDLHIDRVTGDWTYTIDPAKANLLVDETVQDTFTIHVDDGNGGMTSQVVTVDVVGTNDKPTIADTSVTLGSVTEEVQTLATGSILGQDPENQDVSYAFTSGQSSYGFFAINSSTGVWTYTLDAVLSQALSTTPITETFTVHVIDEGGASTPQIVSVTLVGDNDKPVIAGSSTGDVQEDYIEQISGQVTATDIDSAPTDLSWSLTSSAIGTYGSLSFNTATGDWIYDITAGSTVNIAQGDTKQDTFTVEISDGVNSVEQVITINVLGNHIQQGVVGDDILTGSTNNELLWGGPQDGSDAGQADTFKWLSSSMGSVALPGNDIVKDFDINIDTIDLHDVVNIDDVWSSAELAERIEITEVDNEALITINNELGEPLQTITLQGVDLDSLYGEDASLLSGAERVSKLVESNQLNLSDTKGHEGDDELHGTIADDILSGGAGHDSFVFDEQHSGTIAMPSVDTVSDFSIDHDVVDISDLLPPSPSVDDLLSRIKITVNDDISMLDDEVSTVISVLDNQGNQTDIMLDGVGWEQLNPNNVPDIADISSADLLSIMQDDLHILKVDG